MWLLLSWMSLSVGQALANDTPRILVVHAYSQDYPWTRQQHEAFREGLDQALAMPANIKTEYLDTKRLQFDAGYRAFFASYMERKYRDFRPHALYLTDDNALQFGLTELRTVFPGTPMFFSGVNDYSVLDKLDATRVTGVFEKKQIGPNLDLLQQLLGEVGEIIAVGDNSNTYQVIKRELQRELASRPDMRIRYVSDRHLDVILLHLQEQPQATVLLTTLGAVRNSQGEVVNIENTIRRIAASGTRIVVSMEDAYLYGGVLGGYVTSATAQGKAAASLMQAFLNGTPVSALPPMTESPNQYMFDDRVLDKLQLKLPAAIAEQAMVLQPRESLYQRYRLAILVVLVFLALALLATLLLHVMQVSRKNRTLQQQSIMLKFQGKQLQQSEERYRLLFELSEDPMLLIKDNEFVLANDAAGRLLGYQSAAELQMVHPSRLSPERQPDGRLSFEKANEMMQVAYEIGYYRFEWEHLKKNGEPLQIEVSLTRIPYDDGYSLFCVWHDITDWRKAEQALREKSTYLNSLLSASVNVGFIAADADLNINYYNDSAALILGVQPNELQGKSIHFFHDLEGGVPGDRLQAALELCQEQGEYRFSMTRNVENGKQLVDARLSSIWDDSHVLKGYMFMVEDVTKQHEAEELIKYQANYDHLTNLPNRRTLLERLDQTVSRCKRHHHLGAVLFVDLDNFKHINDRLGHTIGDGLLQQVAERMLASVRSEDTVARLGGDEFVILLSEIGDTLGQAIDDATLVAEKLQLVVARPYTIEGHEVRTGSSLGISIFPSMNESADDILRQADTAMYQAKEAGRNNYKFFSPEMQQKVEARTQLLHELHQAVERQEFQVYFQPQSDLHGRLVGVEALVRWQHPQKGLVYPDTFIPLAEESGLIDAISEFVLYQSLVKQLEWTRDYPDSLLCRIAVNVSAKQFQQDDFVEKIINTLKVVGNDPAMLTLELTESMLLDNIDQTIAKMQELKKIGVRFSIDDFGTGYSSLAYLKRLPISEIKIDRSFVQDIFSDPNDSALVKMILSLAKQLNLEVVAEGVETRSIRDALVEYGCQCFQGYYFGKPMPANKFEQRFLASDNILSTKSLRLV
ncbi:MAG: EAL domain-containing protein [Chromatiales bacterium]|jgi:diguanylate cyclase (GGDEF)-like protein/PAS domain S-box-containing protein